MRVAGEAPRGRLVNPTWGADHRGPPPNLAHVREWNQEELRAFLVKCGFTDSRIRADSSSDYANRLETLLAVIRH